MNFVPFELTGCQSHDIANVILGALAAYVVPIAAYVVYRLFLGDRGPS